MTGFDTFPDTDLLPAPTSHAVLSAEVVRLRSRMEQLQEYLERCSHKRNEIGKALDAEREMHERTRVVVARRDVMIDDLRQQLAAQKAGAELVSTYLLESGHRWNEIDDELGVVVRERDEARQALRRLVNSARWSTVVESRYRLVSEEEMQRAAALVREWFQGEESTNGT